MTRTLCRMRRLILLSCIFCVLSALAAEGRADVLLALFKEPSSGQQGVASFNPESLLSMGNIPISPALDSCWIESPGDSLYASSLSGHLDRFDLLTGRRLASAERRDVQWT